MADSDITIVGLSAVGGVSQAVLQWAINDPNLNGLPALKFDHAEVWRGSTASMADAVRIDDDNAFTAFADLPLSSGVTWFYQVRAIDRSGRAGEWTSAVSATTINPTADETPWTEFTPTISASSGTFTTVSARGNYKQIGKTCFFNMRIVITVNGTADGYVIATIPLPVIPGTVALQGASAYGTRFGPGINKSLNVLISNTGSFSSQADIFLHDGTYPGADSIVLQIGGVFERT